MKVGERGQITIPKHLRQRYGLEANAEVELVEIEGRLVLRKKLNDDCAIDEFAGVLGRRGQRSDELLEELRGR